MTVLLHPLNGQTLTLHISRRAKTNIILRPHGTASLKLNIPPRLSVADLRRWLDNHPEVLLRLLQAAPSAAEADTLPETVWYQGTRYPWQTEQRADTVFDPAKHIFRLPERQNGAEHKTLLAAFFYREAERLLPPLLRREAERLQLYPAAVGLTRAKTFWGVCRAKTGIRLNWRLIGAPDFVQEYVCVHELCHLPHPDHSAAFWQTVHRHTPHTAAAQNWLKSHGKELFAPG